MFSRLFSAALAVTAVFAGPASADWSARVDTDGQGAVGQTGQVQCEPGGTPGPIWGTGTYTSDSSICGAAQHFGWLPQGSGAVVTYRTVPGQQSYQGSSQNGITTNDYGSWGLSFQITGATLLGGGAPGGTAIDWSANADSLGIATSPGSTHRFVCPPNSGGFGTIWGTDLYSSDSPICVAAQHRGLISSATGGPVTVLILGEQAAFSGSSRNGITSSDFPTWPRSYTFQ
ncbi:LCCL domain-containing protein [Hasllibacter sp. MH4015]|uniref:LCCL domain-containing protein n=1 Tax=Hasllibacter sp. MH4015 TaxID=2854029 RepID=UPI001CD6D61A|nr:LCCL domain-containing protein [Hasllibacter sp. MH4015]